MNEPAFGIDWAHARVFWRVEGPLTELSAATALNAASGRLHKSHAETTEAGDSTLAFGYTWRAGRSWLTCICGGSVRAVENGDRLVVTIGASPLPLMVYAILAGLVARAFGLSATSAIGVAGLLLAVNYLFVHFGLWRVADAVARAGSAVRAA